MDKKSNIYLINFYLSTLFPIIDMDLLLIESRC